MTKDCKHLCINAFKNICMKSIIHEAKKFVWKFCRKCSVFFKFTLLRSWVCPCCHNHLRNHRRENRVVSQKPNLIASRKWYERNKEKKRQYNIEYYRRKTNKDKDIIMVPIVS